MPSVIVLDSGPLSNAVVPLARPGSTPTLSQQCRKWISDCERGGALLVVPAIAYYETLRELERRRATAKIARLKEFAFADPGRFMPCTTAHLERAAQMWGAARNAGNPTASDDALDGDVILAAQALSLGLARADFIVATTNVGHLSRFVPCDEWTRITP
jgi:predicted nucleic acid-binding protein